MQKNKNNNNKQTNYKQSYKREDDRTDHIEMIGYVVESNSGIFKVEVETSSDEPKIIVARPSGKLRMNKINVVIGDKVQVALSPYDLNNGMIKRRL